jgi:hypothetical protein
VVCKLRTYAERISAIQAVLEQFSKRGVIDKTKLNPLDELAQRAYGDQLRILNKPQLSLDDQRSLFGAARNMQMAAKTMKSRLSTASERKENPITADQALEVCRSLSDLAFYVDEYFVKGHVTAKRTMNDVSRALYKKARRYGFSEDTATQIRELNISSEELKSFTKKLEENIRVQTDVDEDSGSENESRN